MTLQPVLKERQPMQVKQQLSLPWDVVPVNSLIEKKAEHNASLTWSIHLKDFEWMKFVKDAV